MGINRSGHKKRRETGGRRHISTKKRKHHLARPAAGTKIGSKKIKVIRCMGGNKKFRALRLQEGNFSWGSEAISRKTKILNVVYNATNNELVRTNSLTKNTIVTIDATPFRSWYQQHYGVKIGSKAHAGDDEIKPSKKHAKRQEGRELDSKLEAQFDANRLYACISSRPGQSGRADGYILEGAELVFYEHKLKTKKTKK
eukprot:g3348.t1